MCSFQIKWCRRLVKIVIKLAMAKKCLSEESMVSFLEILPSYRPNFSLELSLVNSKRRKFLSIFFAIFVLIFRRILMRLAFCCGVCYFQCRAFGSSKKIASPFPGSLKFVVD